MTKRAAFILATHYRPELLREVLTLALSQDSTLGWEVTATVAGHPDDPGRAVCDELGVQYVPTHRWWAGQRWEAARQATDADLLMLTGDDDLPPPYRLRETVAALHAGHEWTVSSVVRFCSVASKDVALWHGEARHSGCAFGFTAEAMERAGGFPTHRQQGLDGGVSMRLHRAGYRAHNLPAVGLGTLCLEHSDNMWPRVFPAPGQVLHHEPWTIVGQGQIREDAATSPGQVAAVERLHADPPPHRIVARPRWADDAVDWLDAQLGEEHSVLEWGSGDSTLWLASRAGRVTAVEHSQLWSLWGWQRYQRLGAPGDLMLLTVVDADDPERETYVGLPQVSERGPYHVVCVDGERPADCVRRVLDEDLLLDGGCLVVNDMEGQAWGQVEPLLTGWRHVHFQDTGSTHVCVRAA